MKTNNTSKEALINNTIKNMLRYDRQSGKSGLTALYDIWLGNGLGPFLLPLSPHRARCNKVGLPGFLCQKSLN